MDTATKNYIDSLDRRSIPWNRMFTAYGTAEHYNELLSGTTSDLWGSLWTGVEKPTSGEKTTSGVVCALRIPQDSDYRGGRT